ncbi:hypothetical protein ACH5RR_001784 [Cinchona calisaya]|uniref:Uncharacterized protein n=1 Tax=Cinchona calisaya TaxID=153742 RepID=A0ABD3B4H7_9GENT
MEGEFDNNHRLQVDNVQWLTGLSNLQYLDMSTMDLSKISDNLLQVINMIPSLVELRFSWSRLGHISHHLIQSNFSSLAILDLSGTELSSLPRWIFGIRKLASLNLHDNGIEGSMPEGPWNLTLLNHLYLQANYLNGSSLPRELFNLSNLISLDLTENQLEDLNLNGNTCINMTILEDLDISSNNLHSSIPKWLYNCKHLKSLELHSNHLQGAISDDIGNLSSIIHLGLAWNELTGRIPNKIGTLCEIKCLDLSRNKL